MGRHRGSAFQAFVAAAAAAAVVLDAGAALTGSSIPLTDHGNPITGSAGVPLALSPTAFLAAATGLDQGTESADDEALLVTGIGGSPTLTAIPAPYTSGFSGHRARLGATRALVASAGTDGAWETSDDAVLLLDRLGSANTVTPIVVGFLDNRDAWAVERLSADSAVVVSDGPDGNLASADDVLALITDIGGANTVTLLPAPFLSTRGHTRPRAVSPTSVLVASQGPDNIRGNADDVHYLFTDLGGTNARQDLPTPYHFRYAPTRAQRVSATQAVTLSQGADATDATADDALLLLGDLDGDATVTTIPIPFICRYNSGFALPFREDFLVLPTWGPDGVLGNADDALALVSDLGGTNAISFLTVGGLDDYPQSRPTRLSEDAFAFCGRGADGEYNTADDEVVAVRGPGAANTIVRVPLAGLDTRNVSRIVPVARDALLVSNGGSDGVVDSGTEDGTALVTGLEGTPAVETSGLGAQLDNGSLPCVPVPLGRGRSVQLVSGPDGSIGSGNDDFFRVLEGIPQARGITVGKLAIKFDVEAPEKGEKVSARGTLALDDPGLLRGQDLFVSVGNASQAIPAKALREKKPGVFQYKGKPSGRRFLKKVKIDLGKGTFQISGKGVGTGAETTDPDYVPVAFDSGEDGTYLSDEVAGTAGDNGISYTAPE